MIKRFIKRVEESTSEAWVAILIYIDSKLDNHEKRIDKLEEKIDKFDRGFDKTKAEVDANVDRKKGYYKTFVNAVIVGIVAYILSRLGIGGG